MHKNFVFIIFLLTVLSACTSIKDVPIDNNQLTQSIEYRNEQLLKLNTWTIAGKIAFINSKERQSATLHWQKDQNTHSESLNLSTVFGINVLELKREKSNFSLEVDGETYQTQDLDNLIYQLTGLNLPTRAMSHWLKGIAYLPSDHIQYHDTTQLPTMLTSNYNNRSWQINYSKYHHIGPFQLAKQLTIRQDDLRIKIVIHSWQI